MLTSTVVGPIKLLRGSYATGTKATHPPLSGGKTHPSSDTCDSTHEAVIKEALEKSTREYTHTRAQKPSGTLVHGKGVISEYRRNKADRRDEDTLEKPS